MPKTKRSLFLLAFPAIALAYLMLFPQVASAAVSDGLKLCAQTIVPSMFPYFVITEFLMQSGGMDLMANSLGGIMPRMFRVSKNAAAPFILGLLGGYPLGAKSISSLLATGRISKQEAQRLMGFCCNAGPAFIVGAVGGGLYRSTAVGLALYGVHVLSAILCGLTGACSQSENQPIAHNPTVSGPAEALVLSVCAAAETIMKVCSFIVTFMLLISAVTMLLPENAPLLYLVLGLTEISAGCTQLAASVLPWSIKFTMTSGVLALGGLCVFLQTCAVFTEKAVSFHSYCVGKLKQAGFSVILSLPLSFLLQPYASASAFPYKLSPFSPFPYTLLPLILLLVIFLQFSTGNSRRVRL